MKKNILIHFIAILSGSLFLLSCNKLKETAYSQSSPDNFFGSQNDVAAALVGIYQPLTVCCGGYEQDRNFMLNPSSDEGNAILSWGQFDQLTYTPSSAGEISETWAVIYKSISAANFVLDNESRITALDKTSDKSYTKQVLAEAKFLRANNYFDLVRMYGGVPLRIRQAKRANDINIPRSPEDSVYAQIIEDFKYAEQYLPDANLKGRPSKLAASAFLAKVYLTKKDYPNALAEAQKVVNGGTYSLQPTYGAIFNVNNKDNSEVIFDIQYIRKDGYGMRIQFLSTGPLDHAAAGSQGGWGLDFMENGYFQKFKPVDDRINTTFSNPAPGQDRYFTGKWKDSLAGAADGHATNFIVYRYADLLLIYAEAANEVNGPTAEAYSNINQVRERAKIADLTPGLSKDQFRDSVIFERHLELGFEQHRWYDLKRTGKLAAALKAVGKNWDDKYLLFPIPQIEIDASNGLLKQNPGY